MRLRRVGLQSQGGRSKLTISEFHHIIGTAFFVSKRQLPGGISCKKDETSTTFQDGHCVISCILNNFADIMGRLLAIDYGKKRTGIAVTDPSKIVPGGLTTVATAGLMAFLKDYLNRETVDCVIVGWPRQSDGSPSENQQRVEAFITRLQRECPGLEIVRHDERFTSVLAHRTMIDAGLGKKRRQDKALVDEISATIILQSYMDSAHI